MTVSRILIPTAWLLSLSVAFIIGGKTTTQTTNPSSDDEKNPLRSSRENSTILRNSANGHSSTRKNTHSRLSPSKPSRDLEIADIASNEDPIARTSDLLKLIDTLGPNDFQQVIANFRDLGITQHRMGEYGMLLHAWAKADPLGALDYAEEHTGTRFARQTILTSWAGEDPESAVMWAKEHHEGDGANPWLVGAIRGIASHNPSRATEVMLELPFSSERGEALSAITPHIAKQGHDQAIRWLDTITDESLLSGATSYLASNLAKTDPTKTAEWISSLNDSEAKSRAAGQVAEQWAEQDLSAAVTWTDTLDGRSKTKAAGEIIGAFATENPSEAAGWLTSMRNDPDYEHVVHSYIWNTAHNNPEASLAQVTEIKNPHAQSRYYERIVRRWKDSDPAAAAAWMNNNQLPEETIKRINR